MSLRPLERCWDPCSESGWSWPSDTCSHSPTGSSLFAVCVSFVYLTTAGPTTVPGASFSTRDGAAMWGSQCTTVRRGRKVVLLVAQHTLRVWVLFLAPTACVLSRRLLDQTRLIICTETISAQCQFWPEALVLLQHKNSVGIWLFPRDPSAGVTRKEMIQTQSCLCTLTAPRCITELVPSHPRHP